MDLRAAHEKHLGFCGRGLRTTAFVASDLGSGQDGFGCLTLQD